MYKLIRIHVHVQVVSCVYQIYTLELVVFAGCIQGPRLLVYRFLVYSRYTTDGVCIGKASDTWFAKSERIGHLVRED